MMCFTVLEPFYVSRHLSAPCQGPDTAALNETEQITIAEQSCWLNSMGTKHSRASEKHPSSGHPSARRTCAGPALPYPLGGTRLGWSHHLGRRAGALPSPFAGRGITASG